MLKVYRDTRIWT